MLKRIAPATIAAAMLMLGAGPASATEFHGSCVAAGITTFDEGLGLVAKLPAHIYQGTGTCSGELDGEKVEFVPYEHFVSFEVGLNSCTVNVATNGQGTMTFNPGTRRQKKLRFVQTVAGFTIFEQATIEGANEGSALGLLMLPPNDDAREQCENGTIQRVAQTLAWSSMTPLSG